MRSDLHHHPCARCKVRTPCSGHREFNYDGEPVAWCLVFHEPGQSDTFYCEDCAALPACDQFQTGDDCDGGKGGEVRDDSDGYLVPKHFCRSCAIAYDYWRENYDGPGDGEAWSGGFAANH